MADPSAPPSSTQPSGEGVRIKTENPATETLPPNEVGRDELDASIDNDINMTAGEETTTAAGDSAGQNGGASAAVGNNANASVAPGIPGALDGMAPVAPPTKKESSLRDFLGKMDEYAPIVSSDLPFYLCTLASIMTSETSSHFTCHLFFFYSTSHFPLHNPTNSLIISRSLMLSLHITLLSPVCPLLGMVLTKHHLISRVSLLLPHKSSSPI